MKNIYQLIGLFCFLITSTTQAQIIAYEGFDYFNNTAIALHNVNTNNTNTNLATSLGWAGDWAVTSNNTSIPGYNISANNSITYSVGGRNMIDAGKFAVGGNNAQSAGRRLQTSTAGPFVTTLNNYITTNHPSTSGRVGRNSTTLWLAFLLRKDKANDQAVYLSLHRNATVSDGNTGNHIAIGYFGTSSNSGGVRYWSLRINNTVTRSAIPITTNQFTLLVVRIVFNANSGQQNKVDLFVNPTTIGGAIPAAIDLTAQSAVTQDNSFTSIAYYGGNATGESALDEIRFANNYASATSSSDKVDPFGGLCTGTIGDNIFTTGDFGSITGVDESLATVTNWTNPTAVTYKNNVSPWNSIAPGYSYTLNVNNGPGDTYYTIATGIRNPYGNTTTNGSIPFWITSNDRSGTNNGFMMVVNAHYTPGIFYEETINGLCENTRYEFSVEVVNMYSAGIASIYTPNGANANWFPKCDPTTEPGCQQLYSPTGVRTATDGCTLGSGACRRFSILPDIEFLINDVVIYSPPRPINNDGQWKKLGFTFTTRTGVTSLKLSLRNKAPGGIGNDIGLDNFSFKPCGPTITTQDNLDNCVNPSIKAIVGTEYNTPVYQWQKSADNGTNWSNISGATADTYQPKLQEVSVGNQIRVLVANSSNNLLGTKCRISAPAKVVGCALPVKVSSFKAFLENTQVRLNWETAFEQNNFQFVIERSTNGSAFQEIGKIDGRGNSNEPTNYLFMDTNPMNGLNYYRLKQIDTNEKVYYSDIVSIRFNNPTIAEVQFYPNPVRSGEDIKLNVNLYQMKGLKLEIFDTMGNALQNTMLKSGENAISQNLKPGVYFLHFITLEGYKKVERLVIN